jgi:hypothetical protein
LSGAKDVEANTAEQRFRRPKKAKQKAFILRQRLFES